MGDLAELDEELVMVFSSVLLDRKSADDEVSSPVASTGFPDDTAEEIEIASL